MKKIFRYMMLAGFLFCLGCNDWLDVNPKTESREEVQYSTESGFKDVLTGVYIQLASENLYGKQMTMNFTELLAQHWATTAFDASAEHYIRTYDFTQSKAETVNTTIWKQYFEAIANLNNLLVRLEDKKEILSPVNYKLLKGEALGLRGFLHLDILRLWGPVPGVASSSEEAIPYVTEMTKDLGRLLSLPYNQVVGYILRDLNDAEELLQDDPITGYSMTYLNNPANAKQGELEDEWHYYRQNRFNLYAVKATKARYYLWIGEKEKAGAYANEVITALNPDGSEKFRLAQESDAVAGDLTFTTEHIFSLRNPLLEKIVAPIFVDYEALTQNEKKLALAYESTLHPDDIRFKGNRFWEKRSQPNNLGSAKMYFKKYWQTESTNSGYLQLVPVIRLAELYFIAIECATSAESNRLFHKFRIARNMSASIDNSLTDETALYNRLETEYRKEFYGEGQMFYFFKRNNNPLLTWPEVMTMSAEKYRIPKPEGQIIFE